MVSQNICHSELDINLFLFSYTGQVSNSQSNFQRKHNFEHQEQLLVFTFQNLIENGATLCPSYELC